MENGLVPRTPGDTDDVEGVYLFTNLKELDNALMNWLGDRIDEDYVVLKISSEGVTRTVPGAEYEVISTEIINPRFISYQI